MDITHVSGPWQIEDTEQAMRIGIRAADGIYVAEAVQCQPRGRRQERANAKLIAAAPELLKSCKALLEELRLIREKDGPFVYDTTCRIEARAVIAKAE
jgi:hypothetical protein